MTQTPAQNPLLSDFAAAFGLPDFAAIKPEHYRPAFDAALAEHRAEIDAVAASAEPPTFANTIEALEKSGRSLEKVANVFFVLAGADTSDALEAVERDISPLLARHSNALYLNAPLFKRIDDLYARRETLGLTPEQARVLERYHTRFVRAGAGLDKAAQDRLAAINEELATLGTKFSQNVLADEKAYALILEEGDLAGLPDFARAAAAAAAEERGHKGKYAITLARSSCESFLQFSSRRDLREKVFEAWIKRGENGGATDNRATIAETVKLRAERAKLLGFATFADYRLDDQMAKTPAAARKLLDEVWGRARAKALVERDALQEMIAAEGANFKLAPHDWRYYAEKLRKAKYDLDEAEIKPYFQLDKMIEAAFETAQRLFGLTFTPANVPLYHPDARAWDVKDKSGAHVALFIGDYFARGSKHSGAWMTSLRDQQKLIGDTRPVVLNVCNFTKPAAGEPALLSFDDARTLFHEFGHGLHGMLSNVTYPLLSGTAVSSDFVELPSQLYEHWLEVPAILERYARHAKTGEAMPKALLDRLLATRTYGQGFATVEYTACALVDLDVHGRQDDTPLDVTAFERDDLERIKMPAEIVMRHRLPHFSHLFSGGGYAAGYYSYMWSEVLDADAFEAFEETGDAFDPATAQRLRDFIYSAGNLRDPAEAYKAFRGRLPAVDALLKKRGLDDVAA
ncbi:M3 family peptidase [Pseudolabrys taiwanensis]|uniref:M3 family peptidase n=1 Tax=Pseudolabrys taiwanensis TaxID=331696 RepID=A0A346A1P5_9HYPH|nr:M3 family metallopeptidase [Pseudolabrys taiwanensis]AXK83092.1 M3 family peptidase [Pseudolabrys taiwanensis]